VQTGKQKNKNLELIFECHYFPIEFEKKVKSFLSVLRNNDTFLYESNKYIQNLNRIDIHSLTKKEIQDLNLKYREIESPTDVLSFNLEYIGEIDLCFDIIRENAERMNVDFLNELYRCIIHGILHIFGFDHTEKLTNESKDHEPMFILQEKILSECHIK
jgi:probable rRNA maturation factor